MSEYPELDRLVDGIRRRSDDAFTDVYTLTSGGLASFAYSMLRDRRLAEDAVQQAFLELVRSAHTIKGDGRSLRAWLFKSVRFNCLDEIRRRSRRPESLMAEAPDSSVVADELELTEIDPVLERALAELTERQRTLIALRHVVGLSGAEVATVMEMTRPAAYAATERAERRLRKLIEGVESNGSATSPSMKKVEDKR
ncbi:MAG: sigma-70 family RNA polymerase sigma factor [Actinomycetia bacterium]|nr:sigma-70 family RNA polymerase sigma factor [Actinomycetes bacterium]